MIKLENIYKTYKNKKNTQKVLNELNIIFREKEFVSVLGPSGSGKTTLLNIIGTLDNDYEGTYYFGETKVTKQKRKFYDYYRNQMIGFVFQDYNLIEHLSVYKNIELALSLGKGLKKREKIFEVLDKVGLLEFTNTKASKLSGGQKQKVAIARAIVNNPKILLMDEPTGALDAKTSIKIMDLIKEVASDKLIIMVTHNKELAEKYSDRIIEISDGKIKNDSNKCDSYSFDNDFQVKRKIGFSNLNLIKFALNNLKVKFFRNLLTVLAFSISIIGICLVLSISEGVNLQVEDLKEDTLANYPIVVSSVTKEENNFVENYDQNKVYAYKDKSQMSENSFTNKYLDYLSNIEDDNVLGIVKHYEYNFNILTKTQSGINLYDSLPFIPMPNDNAYLKNNYTILRGTLPKNENEIVIKVDENNNLDGNILKLLGIKNKSIDIDELIGRELKIVLNDVLYQKIGNRFYYNEINEQMYNNKENITLTVSGVIKGTDSMEFNSVINEEVGCFYYHESITKKVLELNGTSSIVKMQKEKNYNVLTGEKLDDFEKVSLLKKLGNRQKPYMIYIYPNKSLGKEEIKKYLDIYNEDNIDVKYIDMADDVVSVTKSLVFGITTILFLFSGIALVIAFILIIIITYTSSIERKKEIGIIRSIGGCRKDIKKLFILETITLSFIASVFGIVIIKVLAIPLNKILYDLTELNNLIKLSPSIIGIVILIGVITAILGSYIPSRNASRLDPVKCLK